MRTLFPLAAAVLITACSGGSATPGAAPDARGDAWGDAWGDARGDAWGDTPDGTQDSARDERPDRAPFDAPDAAADVTGVVVMDAFTDAAPEASAPDAVADTGPEDITAFGCPVLNDPVDHPGSPPGDDTFAAFARPFFDHYCIRCHSSTLTSATQRNGAPLGYDWDVNDSIRTNLARIRSAVGVANYMPINPPTPTCDERRRLLRWIDLGTP